VGKTTIEWTQGEDGTPGYSWNPIRARHKVTGKVGHHCEMPSAGCLRCYAQSINRRLGTGLPYKPSSLDQVEPFLDEKVLRAPLHWRKPRKIFVESMSDLFGHWVPDEWIDKVFAIMAMCQEHTFQCLTKRAERARGYLLCVQDDDKDLQRFANVAADLAGSPCAPGIFDDIEWPFRNVWLGVSTEDQKTANERIPFLLRTPAAVRFISAEPLLGPIDFNALSDGPENLNALTGLRENPFGDVVTRRYAEKLDLVIVGGESGQSARPCDFDWIGSIIQQCKRADVAVFVKQVGSNPVWTTTGDKGESFGDHFQVPATKYHPTTWGPIEDPKGGKMEEWPADLRVREFPKTAVAKVQHTCRGTGGLRFVEKARLGEKKS
jgi:protein gp37